MEGKYVQTQQSLTVDAGSFTLATPLVTRERFADLLGLPPGVIVGWINKGMLPTVTIGKYSLVNVELLRKSCLDREFTL